MSGTNPLSSGDQQPAPADTAPHPLVVHARLWQHAHSLDDDALTKATDTISYLLPIVGKLAGDPNVKPKDVIKAAASAAADGKVTAQEAVQFISQMPTEADKLQPFLKQFYGTQMAALVQMKAAQMARADGTGAQGAPPTALPQSPPPAATSPMPAPQLTPGGVAP